MLSKTAKTQLVELLAIKKQLGFKIVDTHFHPRDVMGIVNSTTSQTTLPANGADQCCVHEESGPLEIFKYDRLAKVGTDIAFRYLPGFIMSTIRQTYSRYSRKAFDAELEFCEIDNVCLLPIAPWATTESIGEAYMGDPRFYILASIDIHKTPAEAVPKLLNEYESKYHIVGIKLHPNLQGFHPTPSKNQPEVARTLIAIYEECSRRNLYMHFHAGSSFYTAKVDPSFGSSPRSHDFGRFENFFTDDGGSEIFGRYACPILIAHLASYGVWEADTQLIQRAIKLHSNLFFDTSGVSPRIISKFIKEVGWKYLVFGSDGPYNRIAYNLIFLWKGLKDAGLSDSERVEAIPHIYGETYGKSIKVK